MNRIWSIIRKINGFMGTKNFSSCDNSCRYYDMYREDYQKQEDIKISIAKLIKENDKYFLYEIERATLDCIIYDSSHVKTLGYSHRVAYEVFEKYGIFMYTSDLITYINSPRNVKYGLQILVNRYGIEKVTEEIAIYLKDNYPQRFGIGMVCKQ